MALDPEALVGRLIGPYRVEALLGSGTFAWVYRARAERDGRQVALKTLRPRYAGDPEFETRFQNEFRVAGELRHPNVVPILYVGQDAGLTFFAMDYCPESLAARVLRGGPVPEPDLIAMARDVASALAFAHRAGVIHRDIKPDNILFRTDGTAVLADFGIARVVSAFVRATGAQMTIGTPHYVSPEQAQGQPLDGRSDLYSLGITLYKAATGVLPFRAIDWFELARMHVEAVPEPPASHRPDLSPEVNRLILRLMAKSPDDRFPSAEALLDALDALPLPPAAAAPAPAPPRAAPLEARRRSRPRRAVVLVVTGVLLALLVAALSLT